MFNIEFFTKTTGKSPVKDFIFEQNQKTINKIFEVIDYLKEFGFGLPTNYLRLMSGTSKLWELRIKAQSKNYRIFLSNTGDRNIILLHAILKKKQKTPVQDIKTAEERLRIYETSKF